MVGSIHVGRCTPLVTCVIGTSSNFALGKRGFHMPRATSPWRLLTALVERAHRMASGEKPSDSVVEVGSIRLSELNSSREMPI